jgi:hypothetical protein
MLLGGWGLLSTGCGGGGLAGCDAASCAGCCDAAGVCQAGGLSAACGAAGAACRACLGGLHCAGGACVPEPCGGGGAGCEEGWQCCSGVCDGAACRPMPAECENIAGERAAQVCLRWRCDRLNRSEGHWSGSVQGCAAGDNAVNRANALRLVNLQRFLAGQPEVVDDPARNQKAQACALLMHANGRLSHTPPTGWQCYSAEGAEAAGKSNLGTSPGVTAVDMYMVDPGNPSTLGHRRWILSDKLGPVGLGSTDGYSCMWTLQGQGASARQWTAWPAPGPFPLQAFTPVPIHWTAENSVNATGWSIQSEKVNLSGAQVTVTLAGVSLPVTVVQLSQHYGSTWALRFHPQGWSPQAGRTYKVEVGGISEPFSYEVQVVDCGS